MLGMEKGGADIIELGMPYTDPLADGPTVQHANLVALQNGVTLEDTIDMVKKARDAGLTIPVVLMGYYNPILVYGEEKLVEDAKKAGANGFIIVDLPPEEAIDFRSTCTNKG